MLMIVFSDSLLAEAGKEKEKSTVLVAYGSSKKRKFRASCFFFAKQIYLHPSQSLFNFIVIKDSKVRQKHSIYVYYSAL